MDPDIEFEFEGCKYTVGSKAYDLGRIILPDGRMLEAEAWLKSYLPQPQGLHEVLHTFQNLEPEKIAELLDAILAVEVEVHNPSEGAIKVYWSKSMQRHHDYHVFLYRHNGGKLPDEDMEGYKLAMERERSGEVKSLPEDAVSPFASF